MMVTVDVPFAACSDALTLRLQRTPSTSCTAPESAVWAVTRHGLARFARSAMGQSR
jgi:hypothetical protein